MVIRVECRHRVGFGVVVEHVARIYDDVHPVVAVDYLLGFRKIQSFSCLCSETKQIVCRMASYDRICIRFHFGGQFTNVGGAQFYVGGDIAESWIDLDRLSFFEIKGHLADHYNPPFVLRLFWLIPGKHESNGWSCC